VQWSQAGSAVKIDTLNYVTLIGSLHCTSSRHCVYFLNISRQLQPAPKGPLL
jgi:hypothetical protein